MIDYSNLSNGLRKKDAPGTVLTEGYGLLRARDPRDALHQLMPDHEKARRITVKHWQVPSVLDQGAKPHCVGYAAYNYLRASPVRNSPPQGMYPADIYAEAQLVDEWPGEGYEGTSVRGAFKFLKSRGYVGSYEWAADAEDVVSHLLTAGPVVLGTDWHQGMDRPGPGSYVWPEGDSLGGHAYLAIGTDRERKNPDGSRGAVRIVNSWGRSWGDQGRAWITAGSLTQLIQNLGEACVAREILVKPGS